MTDLFTPWRLSARGLQRSPLFTAVTVATLSLSIGAATAVYSFVDGVLLSSLSYDAPERLALVQTVVPEMAEQYPVLPVNVRSIEAWRRNCRRTCRELVALVSVNVAMTGEGAPEALRGAAVSPDFFEVMRVRPMLGRGFLPEEAVDCGSRWAASPSRCHPCRCWAA